MTDTLYKCKKNTMRMINKKIYKKNEKEKDEQNGKLNK